MIFLKTPYYMSQVFEKNYGDKGNIVAPKIQSKIFVKTENIWKESVQFYA